MYTHTHTFVHTGVVEVSKLFEAQSITPILEEKCIQLLEKFEVALKINQWYLVIPSMMLTECPSTTIDSSNYILPSSARDYRLYQPPLRRFWLSAFVPSNYWHHLFCKIATDQRIEELVHSCCAGATCEGSKRLNWSFWATGMAYTLRGRTLFIVKQQRNEEASHGEEFRIEAHVYTPEWVALSSEGGRGGKDPGHVLPLVTNLLVVVSQHILVLALDWFPGMLLGHPKPSTYVPCWKCYEAVDCTTATVGDPPMGDDFIYHNQTMVHCFDVDQCVAPAVLGKELTCVFHNGLEVLDMVPDLVSTSQCWAGVWS